MKTYFLILAIPLLFACEKKKELSSETPSLEGGTWVSGCGYDGSSSSYQVRSAGFTGGQFAQGMTIYSGAGCASGLIKMDFTGSYVLGGSLYSGSSMQKLDLTLATLTLTVLNASVVSSYNTSSMCGFSNWALGVGKNVTGLTCNSSPMPSAGEVTYDIYNFEDVSIPSMGIVEGTLNFGYNDASHDGTSDATRPDSLNGNFDFTR
jgi:hypothetical protein